jgi:formate dehydrogenase maturation protein FdhE
MPLATMMLPALPSVRATLAEQFAPVLHVHSELVERGSPTFDVEDARARIAGGQVGYDALRVLRSCGDLQPDFVRVLDAFEVAGFVSNDDRRLILDGELDIEELVSGWFTGDCTPRDARRRTSRQVAIVVGNAMLRSASAMVGPAATWKQWSRLVCPCCGGSPDIVLTTRASHRTLVCARCDTTWRAQRSGCLGCDTSDPASLAKIANPALDYDLVMCNACGRFIKERPRRGLESLIVERALTTERDLAAEQRGLRI